MASILTVASNINAKGINKYISTMTGVGPTLETSYTAYIYGFLNDDVRSSDFLPVIGTFI
jgi:hypothetical protein